MSDAPFAQIASSSVGASAMTWHDLQQRVREAKKFQLTQCNHHQPTSFVLRRRSHRPADSTKDDGCSRPEVQAVRVYFLGLPSSSIGRRESTLLYADFVVPQPPPGQDTARQTGSDADGPGHPLLLPSLTWQPLLDADAGAAAAAAAASYGELSREEQLLRERRRIVSAGITAYDAHVDSGKFAFILAGGLLATCTDLHFTARQVAPQITLRDNSGAHNRPSAAKLDPKICPASPQLVAYVCDGDLWVHSDKTGFDARLTFVRQGRGSSTGSGGSGSSSVPTSSCQSARDHGIALDEPRSCGAPPFVIQEEFDRCTGYWWQPVAISEVTAAEQASHVYRILYEEVDESDVDVVFIPAAPAAAASAAAGALGSSVATASGIHSNVPLEAFRYPRAGTNNSKSTVKVVQFNLDDSGQVVNIVNLQLWPSLESLFPWAEYLVRLDWHPSGSSVWLQLLDRLQQRLVLALLPLDLFVTPEAAAARAAAATEQHGTSRIIILREEVSSSWLNVHDGLYFLQEEVPGVVTFLWLSESTGHQHLYLCHGPSTDGDSKPATSEALTSGEWEVNGQQLWVDEERKLVFFMGTMDTVLESHLYCVSYGKFPKAVSEGVGGNNQQLQQHHRRHRIPRRLTEPGYSHVISMDVALGVVVDTFSSVSSSATCRLSRLCHGTYAEGRGCSNSGGCSIVTATLAPFASLLAPSSEWQPCYGCGRGKLGRCNGAHNLPKLTSFQSSSSGVVTHCLVYEPAGLEPGRLYPTILFVYGGPQVQLITNADKSLRYTRLSTMASLGYAVIMMDCRGSKGRGLAYESHLKDRLGSVEVADQVEGLQALAAQLGYIDLDRVAVHGWSYGGYLALMALAQRPDVFKVCIAGAPVTAWQLYDTGYTERYMGLPKDNEQGYHSGSVVSYADYFPDSPGRLLIIHGLIDENVHFFHTSLLLNALVKAGKPYQLQIYPAERHGIRSPEANEHFETTVLHFISQNL